jgi:hypothetical protein
MLIPLCIVFSLWFYIVKQRCRKASRQNWKRQRVGDNTFTFFFSTGAGTFDVFPCIRFWFFFFNKLFLHQTTSRIQLRTPQNQNNIWPKPQQHFNDTTQIRISKFDSRSTSRRPSKTTPWPPIWTTSITDNNTFSKFAISFDKRA